MSQGGYPLNPAEPEAEKLKGAADALTVMTQQILKAPQLPQVATTMPRPGPPIDPFNSIHNPSND